MISNQSSNRRLSWLASSVLVVWASPASAQEAPVITQQSTSQAVLAGSNGALNLTVAGTGPHGSVRIRHKEQRRQTMQTATPGILPWCTEALAALSAPSQETNEQFAKRMDRILPFYWSDSRNIAKFKDDFAATTFSVEARQGQRESRNAPWDLRPQLSKIAAPALIAVGVDDFICSPVCAREMHMALRKLLVIERAGHFPWIEQVDEFNKQVPKFLKSMGIRGPETQ